MARPRLTREQIQLRGSRIHRVPSLELTPGPLGDPPEWLGTEGRAEWERVTSNAEYAAALAPVHASTLAEYCGLWQKQVDDARGTSKMTGSERAILNSLRGQLGLSPATQSRIPPPKEPKKGSK